MTQGDTQPTSGDTASNKIKFDYIKSNHFRVIHVDGVSGGITPNLDIHMAFWNERSPIPKRVEYEMTEEGNFIEEIESRDAIVREVEVSMILDEDTAEFIIEWLQQQLYELREEFESDSSQDDESQELED